MKVQLEINIGDPVWFMYDNQAVCGYVKNILYRQFISNLDHESVITVEKYTAVIKDHKYANKEREVICDKNELFPDKESLIKSL